VPLAAPAEPASGTGIKVGYLSNLEAVPIVRVISEGIREQAKIVGVELVFCDGNGENATALNCAKTFKAQGVNGLVITGVSPFWQKVAEGALLIAAVSLDRRRARFGHDR